MDRLRDEVPAFETRLHTYPHLLPSPTPPRSGLARLREEDEDGKDDLPRNDLEECYGSNRVGGKHTGTGRGAVGQKIVPMPDSRMGGGSKSPRAARRRGCDRLHGPVKPAHSGLEGPC